MYLPVRFSERDTNLTKIFIDDQMGSDIVWNIGGMLASG